MRTKQFHLRSM